MVLFKRIYVPYHQISSRVIQDVLSLNVNNLQFFFSPTNLRHHRHYRGNRYNFIVYRYEAASIAGSVIKRDFPRVRSLYHFDIITSLFAYARAIADGIEVKNVHKRPARASYMRIRAQDRRPMLTCSIHTSYLRADRLICSLGRPVAFA